ncbi:hypothetical protein AVEN_220029-1 [Araneus ventricosus]|uniref:Uncharacterized protein n=1 Tax=Araneus ventricosus TaxID=182803 RepID=A0A4Y2CS04_ARAVE|nr:hypothetical protein AVEN_220029-1 [Araneus ventricosus]
MIERARISVQCSFMDKPRSPSSKVSDSEPDGSNPLPLKIRHVLGLLHVKSYIGGKTPSRWCGAEVWRVGACSGDEFRANANRMAVAQVYPRHVQQGSNRRRQPITPNA